MTVNVVVWHRKRQSSPCKALEAQVYVCPRCRSPAQHGLACSWKSWSRWGGYSSQTGDGSTGGTSWSWPAGLALGCEGFREGEDIGPLIWAFDAKEASLRLIWVSGGQVRTEGFQMMKPGRTIASQLS